MLGLLRCTSPELARRDISRRRSNSVAFGAKWISIIASLPTGSIPNRAIRRRTGARDSALRWLHNRVRTCHGARISRSGKLPLAVLLVEVQDKSLATMMSTIVGDADTATVH